MKLYEDSSRFLDFCQKFKGMTNSQSLQDLFALYFKGPKPGYFLEFGIANGSKFSNTLLLELMGWDGLAGEPNPWLREEASRRRSIPIVSEALYEHTGKTLRFDCNGLYGGLSNTSEGREQEKRSDQTGSIDVRTIKLRDLLDREKCPKNINFLSLDIEGAEETILADLPIEKYRFHCISVEHNFGVRRQKIESIMISHGFVRVFERLSGHDDWYINSSVKPRGWPQRLMKQIDSSRGRLHIAKCLEDVDRDQAIANLYAMVYTVKKPHPRTFTDLVSMLKRGNRLVEAEKIARSGLEIYPDNGRLDRELRAISQALSSTL